MHHPNPSVRPDRRPRHVRAGLAAALVLAFPLLLAGCAEMLLPVLTDFPAATRAADRWVARHPRGWTLDLDRRRALARPDWSAPCSRHPESGFVTLRHRSAGTEIDLAFRCPLDASAGVQELEAAFSHAVLQELPHGVAVPGWRFHVRTPTSSINDKVDFSRSATGRLVVSIETRLYGVHGHSRLAACQPPADAPSPAGCYLFREHRVPLRLRLSVPFDLDALE